MPHEINSLYPSKYETEAVLRDGSSIRLRPIMKDDTEQWLAFLSRLSTHTKYLRFHHVLKQMVLEDAVRFCMVDYTNTFALVAEVMKEQRKEIVAIGRYYRLPNKRSAEVAFAIEDAYQGKGIGTKLMESLANIARDNGITTFEADVLAGNEDMMNVFRDYGFHVTSELESGVYHVIFPIARTATVMKKEEERERIATIASLNSILRPKSVAIIGAARHPGTIGHLLLQCILQNGFSGTVYPVNPNAESVMAVKAYPSILDVPGTVDLAIIAVPASAVAKVADECGRKGVRAVVVISDGFKERGPEGASREKELRDVVFGHGMRLVGPNCMGVINTDPQVVLNATFSPVFPPQGNVAFLSQSGAMGLVILEYANNLNMGISTFISVGNRADISSNDLLQYWQQDPATKVILLYMESFGNPGKFSRIARKVSAKKPIIALKSGGTQAGSRAASSHTGAMATSDVASDVLFHDAGIIRVSAMEELFDVATLLSTQPLPGGKRLVIVTNGGGPGIMAADAAVHNGLLLPEFSQETVSKLKSIIKRDIRLNNPLDMTAGATAEEYDGVLRVLALDKDSDAVLAIFIPPVVTDTAAIEDAISRIAPVFWRNGKPLLACFLGKRGFKAKLGSKGKFVPCYPFPEEAVSALAKAAEYAELKKRPRGKIPQISGIGHQRARGIIQDAMVQSIQRPLWLSAKDIANLLQCYGIRFVETLVARTPDEAANLASKIGFPVAVKLTSSTILHKTDVGGVILDLNSEGEVRQAFNNIKERLAKIDRVKEMEGVAVQRMVKEGIEVIVGVTQDSSFGPLIMFGSGGIYAELIKDVALRLHPITDIDAREMVSSVKMAKLFEGFRGLPPSDTQAIEDLLLRLSALVEDIPQVAELDFNPVKVMPRGEGYWVIDARVMLK
ncbi:MAG: GNAT family N-acetyltransferase [Dehalococcoidia bacterium]|nr:GNAT family N-acetyltransferase [Dehalococcoidia bacterium]